MRDFILEEARRVAAGGSATDKSAVLDGIKRNAGKSSRAQKTDSGSTPKPDLQDGLDLLKKAEVAKLLRVTPKCIDDMVREGRMCPFYQFGKNKFWQRTELLNWMISCRSAA